MEAVPSVVAILLCDRIIEEIGTHKKTLVGIFDRVNVPAPVKVPVGFYVRMTDAEGEYKFRVDVMKLTGERLIGRLETSPIMIESRLGVTEIGLNLPPVPFPSSGRYEFQLYGNDVYIGHIALDVAGDEGGTQDASS